MTEEDKNKTISPGSTITEQMFADMKKRAKENPIDIKVERSKTDDKDRERLGMDFEIEATLRIGYAQYKATAQFPLVLVPDLRSLGATVFACIKTLLDKEIDEANNNKQNKEADKAADAAKPE